MNAENVEMGSSYQSRLGKVGEAIRIEADVVTLRDHQGDSLVVSLSDLEYAPVFNENGARIELNPNDPAHKANAFLMIETVSSCTGWDCAGGAELVLFGDKAGKWKVDIAKEPMEPSGNDDCRIVGFFDDQETALEALWSHRVEAREAFDRCA